MSLTGVVPLDAVCLLLARIELPDRQEHAVDGVIICAVQAGAPAPQALDQALASGFVTTAAFPVHQLIPLAKSSGRGQAAIRRTRRERRVVARGLPCSQAFRRTTLRAAALATCCR